MIVLNNNRFVIEDTHYIVYPSEYVITVTEKGPDPFFHHSDINTIVECLIGFYGLDLEGENSNFNLLKHLFSF